MDYIRSLSLKKTLLIYLLTGLVLSFFISYMIVDMANEIQQSIWYRYVDEERYSYYVEQDQRNSGLDVKIARPPSPIMSEVDRKNSEHCDFVTTWTPLILSFISAGIAVYIFYRDKLKVPIYILTDSSSKIANNNLDFHITYPYKDEMGNLCTSFEVMRQELQRNNGQMWKMIEEQKRLKSAIAHDLRTPLTILKGYHEMLMEFMPQDKIDLDKLKEMMIACDGQTDRLLHFVEGMKELSSMEDRSIQYETIHKTEFIEQLRQSARLLARTKEIQVELAEDPQFPFTFQADSLVLHEVYENLISNGVRFAAHTMKITISINKNMLEIKVSDDGIGFQGEGIHLATNAYYHDNIAEKNQHYGLGLYLCKILCEKHGGKIQITNQQNGGAEVTATFQVQ